MVPLIIAESTSAALRRVFHDDPELLVWWGTEVEVASAFARLERLAELPVEDTARALTQLDRLASGWTEIAPTAGVRRVAVRVLRSHRLRAPDALQLAAALSAAGHDLPGVPFVCLDTDLAAAARREGFTVIDGGSLGRQENSAATEPTGGRVHPIGSDLDAD